MNAAERISPNEFRQHGAMLLPCVAGIVLVSVHGYSLGTMIRPLEEAYGWSRAEISAGGMIIACVSLFLSPFVGGVIDRAGPRLVAIAGVISYALLLAFLSTATGDIWSWWLRWGLLGLASTMILPTVWMTAINSRFEVNRGKALAIALLGTGLSAALVPSLTSALLDHLDWRQTYLALSAIVGGAELVLVLIFFYGATARRAGGKAGAPVAVLPGLTGAQGVRSAAFSKLAVGVFVFGVTSLALTINAVPILESRGFERSAAAGIAGLLGIGSIVGRLGGGFLLDRYEARKIAAASVAAPILSIALLMVSGGNAWLCAVAMLLLGLSLGAEVDACSYLSARHFGMRAFGKLFGTINGCVVFGSGIAPVVANYIFDVTGSYDAVLWGTIPLCLFASALFLSLGCYPEFPPVASHNAIDETALPRPA